MENNNNNKENRENKNILPYEKYLKKILENQKKLQNLSIVIILLLSALIVIKLYITG